MDPHVGVGLSQLQGLPQLVPAAAGVAALQAHGAAALLGYTAAVESAGIGPELPAGRPVPAAGVEQGKAAAQYLAVQQVGIAVPLAGPATLTAAGNLPGRNSGPWCCMTGEREPPEAVVGSCNPALAEPLQGPGCHTLPYWEGCCKCWNLLCCQKTGEGSLWEEGVVNKEQAHSVNVVNYAATASQLVEKPTIVQGKIHS